MKKIIAIVIILVTMVQCCSCSIDLSDLEVESIAEIANKALHGIADRDTMETYVDEKESSEKSIKFEKMIAGFEESPLNVFELTLGENHVPGAAIWIEKTGGPTYSGAPDVVTVNKYGKVTAVGKGEAFVVIVSPISDAMYQVYKYVVYGEVPEADLSRLPVIDGIDFEKEIENFEETPLNTKTLKVDQADSPTAAIWAQNGGKCYTSDDSVVAVDSNGTVSAVGEGTAYVIIKSGIGNMFEMYKYKVKC